jgi:hypothetical protein
LASGITAASTSRSTRFETVLDFRCASVNALYRHPEATHQTRPASISLKK